MNKTIIALNTDLIGTAMTKFAIENRIPITSPEFAIFFSESILDGCNIWYNQHGMTFNPQNELIDKSAIDWTMSQLVEVKGELQMMAFMLSFAPAESTGK